MASVGLVVPVLNGVDFLQGLLGSLEQVWDLRIDYIHVIDNASADGSGDFAEQWLMTRANLLGFVPQVTRFSENRGFGPAVNVGLQAALERKGIDYVCVFNVDQLVRKWWLDWLLRALREYPRLGMAGPLIWEQGTPEEFLAMELPHNGSDAPLQIEHRERAAPHRAKGCPWLFRRACLEEVGFYDEIFQYSQMEDSDHMLRMTLAGWEYAKIANCPAYHFVGSRGQQEARQRLGGRNFAQENREKFEKKWGTIHLQELMPEPLYR